MSKFLRFKTLSSITFIFIAQITLSPLLPAMAAEPTQAQLESAAKILCQALSEGKSPSVAKDAARAYLITEVGSKNLLSADGVRQKLQPLVRQQCPDQVMKLIDR